MPRIRPHALPIRIAGLVAAGLAVAGCSSGGPEAKREYAVPASLCGVALPASTLEPLLPAGKKISSVKSGPSGFTRCRLVVDGRIAVTSIIEQRAAETTLSGVAYSTYGMSDTVEREGKYVISDAQAVGHASCDKPRKADHETFTMVRADAEDVGKATMEKVISKFTDAVSASKRCAG
ncbi:hypothetical protein H4K36_27365 [Streptomyces sp. DHE7-1]|nr:hypothetical protein [Streptomyces sp. DHE7-1]